MKIPFLLLALAIAMPAHAGDDPLPPEVADFIRGRDLCEHFRSEPFEGNRPEQIERRNFLAESWEIHCAGTDRRLAALKRRYRQHAETMQRLDRYEEQVEGPPPCPSP